MRIATARELLDRAISAAWQLNDPTRVAVALARVAEDCEVVFSEAIPTARILRLGARYRIEISRAFVAKWISDDEAAGGREILFLLLHEAQHRVQGDLLRQDEGRRDPVGRFVANVVADQRGNSFLIREFFTTGMPLLERFYGQNELPGLLLLPPDRLLAPRAAELGIVQARGVASLGEVARLPRARVVGAVARAFRKAGRSEKDARALAACYLDAWLECDSTDEGLYSRLRPLLGTNAAAAARVVFLGDHDTPFEDDGEPGEALEELGNALEAGAGGQVREDRIAPEVPPALDTLRRTIREALSWSERESDDGPAPSRGVLPSFGRRELFLLASGVTPMFWPQRTPGRVDDGEAVTVFVDVSASTRAVQPLVYGFLVGLGPLVREPVRLFSTVVREVTLEDIVRGVRDTDGGTSFDCVVVAALEGGVGGGPCRKILLVTDGEGTLSSGSVERIRAHGIGVFVLLTKACPETPLTAIARRVWTMPEGRLSQTPVGQALAGGARVPENHRSTASPSASS